MSASLNDAPQVWLLARTSGLFAYAALTCAVVAGLTLKTRLFGRSISPAVITVVHQTLSSIGILSVVLHAGLLVADTHIDMPLLAALIPGLSGHAPVATSLGVIATELWIVVHLSFSFRSRIGVQRWRALHKVVFLVWGLAAIHGIFAGSDAPIWWVQQMYALSIGVVGALIAFRVFISGSSNQVTKKVPVATKEGDGNG